MITTSKSYKDRFTTHSKRFVKGNKWFAFFVGLVLSTGVLAQSPIYFTSGNYTPPNNWAQGSAQLMGTVAGTNIVTVAPNGTGFQYFRLYSATSGGTTYEPNGGADIQLSLNTSTALQVTGSGKAYYLNVGNTGYRYVIKTTGSGSPGTSTIVAFEVQGTTIQTVSSVTQSPLAGNVVIGQATKVTANLSGAFSSGQAVYLRYTTNAFATSTVVQMTGSGTSYTASIPSGSNTSGANVSYYVFTSGTSNVAADGSNADLFTINLNNNGGSNYSYTPNANVVFTDDFSRATLNPGGTPSMTYTNTLATGATGVINTSSFAEITSGTSAGVSYITGPTSTFASPYNNTLSSNPGTITWTFNMRWNRASSNNPAPPGTGGVYGQAVVLGGTNSNISSAGNGYAVVYGSTATPDPIRLVAYTTGVTGTLTDICTSGASDIANTNNYASVRVTYVPSTNTWSLFVRDDGASAWANPLTGVTSQKGSSTVNSTYTGSALTSMGFLWSHSTTVTNSGQFDNFTVQVPQSPILSTPTVSTITNSSAVLGATVTSNGGSTLTARGTSYKTTTGVVATDNQLAEGGTSVSAYSHTRSSLSPQTQYFYVGYATNASATGISSEGNFRTLSNPPTAQATSLTGTPISSSQIDLSWTAGTFPGSGATQGGYLIVYSTGTPSLVGSPNGLTPASAVSVGTIVSSSATVLPSTPSISASATGLATATAYNFLVIPYTWDGTNSSTYNYYTTSPATASGTTNSGAPSLTTPTVSTITENSAVLGATVTSNGGSSLTARGTSYKTSAGVAASDNQLAEGGTTVAAYTHTRSGLAAQTQYFYVGYASNSTSTGISSESNFRTLSNPATVQPTTFTATPGSSSASLSWSNATYPSSGATQYGYLLIYSTGTPALVGTPNGLVPASAVSVGTIISTTATNNPTLPSTSATQSGLSNGTLYNFLLVPYTWDGTNVSTYNYFITGAKTSSCTPAPTTYTYIGTGTSSWATPGNWSPSGPPGSGDGVIFNGSSAVTVTNVPTGITLAKLALSGTGAVNLQSASSGTLNIGGGSSPQLSIGSTSSLNFDGVSALTLNVTTGNIGTISGNITFTNAAHNLTAADANGITFSSPANFTQGTGCTGNVFGSGTSNSIIFGSGTTFTQNAGSNPFSKTQPASVVVFQAGNLYLAQQANGGGLSFSGRTFANLEYNATGTVGASGTAALVVNNLIIDQGTFNWGMTTTPGHAIKGNITVASGAALNFSAGGTTTFSGSSPQTISGAGTIAITGSHILTVASTSTVNLNMNLSVVSGGSVSLTTAGTWNCLGESVISGAGTFTMSGAQNAQLGIGSANGISASGATGNIQTTTRSFQNDAYYSYVGTTNQITGGGLPSSVRLLTINNSGTSGNNIVTLTNSVSNQNNSSPTYSVLLAAGKLNLNNKTLTTIGVQSTGGDFTSTAGPVSFTASSPSQCTGTINFPTVVMGQAVDFGTASTIVTSLTINGGNVANTHPPFYATGSTLIYNTSYGVFDEWKAGLSGAAGVPYHVTINSAMTVNLGNNPTARLTSGNLNVSGTLTFGANSNALTVNGNVNINSTGTLTLSTAGGGDIKTNGDWNFTQGGLLNTNGRAVFFTGSALQTINRTTSGTLNFDYILNQNTSGGIKQSSGTNININGATNGLQLQGTGSGATWDLNGNTMTIATNTNIAVTGSQAFASSTGSGTLAISGGTSNVNSGTGLSFGSNVTVALNGGFDFGSSLSTFNSGSIMQINAGGFVNTNPPIYGSSSTLRYNSATTYGRNLEWSATSGAGYPYNVEVASGTTLDLSANGFADRAMAGSLNLIGSLTMGATTNKLTVGGNITIGGTLTLSTQVGGDIYLGGNWLRTGSLAMNSRAVFFNGASGDQTITRSGGEAIDYLFVDKAAGKVINASDLTIGQSLTISNGTFEVGTGTTLDMVSNQITGTGSLLVTGTYKTSKAAGFSGTASTSVMNTISSITLGSASTVDYSSGGSQTITAGNYANLSNSGDGNRTLANSGTIGISGALTPGAGNYTITGSTVEYNGTSAQTAVALAPDSKYNNLKINNAAGVGMTEDLNLEDALTLTSGALTTTGFNFTLLSSATKTARIAPVTGGSITGNVVMQRFAAGGNAGWATLGMPVQSATINEWNDDILITGINGGASGTGSFVSIYNYNEGATGNANDAASYVAVADVTDAVDPKKGYFVFLGDNATTVSDKLIDVVGPPLIGSQTFSVSYTANTSSSEDGWNLIANPYCSAIDWLSSNWTKTNIDDAIYIYDADNLQYTGSVGGFTYNGGNEIISSSQAFLVHAYAASPVLIATEGVKDAGSPTFYKTSSAASMPGVLRLQLDGLNGTYSDETVFRTVSGASSSFDHNYDAYKLYSLDPSAPNICSKLNGIEYVVNTMDELTSNLDLLVRVNVNTPGSYTINFKGLANFSNVTCFTFEDKFTNTTIDLKVDSSYTFTSGIDTALAYNRFVLHFGVETIVPSVLPSATTVSIPGNATVNFANMSTGASNYTWNFGDASPLDNTISPSHTYTAAGIYTVTLTAANTAGCSQATTFTITVDDVTGINHVTASEQIIISKDQNGVYANYNFAKNTEVKVNIYNALGAQVGETQIAKVQNKGQFAIVTNDLAKGLYTLELLFDNKKQTKKLDF